MTAFNDPAGAMRPGHGDSSSAAAGTGLQGPPQPDASQAESPEAARPPAELRPDSGPPQAFHLRSAEFRKGREQSWRQLEDIIGRLEKKGLKALSAEEVERLPLLHRAALSSLSVARNIVLDRHLLLYLEDLAMRSYLAVYGPRVGLWKSCRDFFSQGFPRAVREIRWHLAAAFLALLVGVAAGYLLVVSDPNYFHMIVPEDLAGGRGPGSTAEELEAVMFAPWSGYVDTFVVFANFLFRHNTIVGILAFGLCFALGVPTIFLLIHNGVVMGAFIAIHAQKGLAFDFIGWLSIHGVTEILAILLCGAAGLAVAEKIVFPGRLPRLASLALYGRRAASIVAGAVALFFIASILEGGFRQLVDNTLARYAFAAATGAFWLYYFSLAGKERIDAQEN